MQTPSAESAAHFLAHFLVGIPTLSTDSSSFEHGEYIQLRTTVPYRLPVEYLRASIGEHATLSVGDWENDWWNWAACAFWTATSFHRSGSALVRVRATPAGSAGIRKGAAEGGRWGGIAVRCFHR